MHLLSEFLQFYSPKVAFGISQTTISPKFVFKDCCHVPGLNFLDQENVQAVTYLRPQDTCLPTLLMVVLMVLKSFDSLEQINLKYSPTLQHYTLQPAKYIPIYFPNDGPYGVSIL